MRFHMSKRLVAACLASAMVLGFAGCAGAPAETTAPSEKPAEGIPALTLVEGAGKLSTENGIQISSGAEDRTIVVGKDAGKMKNSEAEIRFDPANDNVDGMYGIIFRYTDDGDWTFVGQDGVSGKDPVLTSWVVMTSDGMKQHLLTDGQRIYKGRLAPYTLKVRLIDDTITIYLDNAAIYSGEVRGVTEGEGYTGLCYVNGSGADIKNLTITPIEKLASEESGKAVEIASETLKVTMDESFPRVIGYEMTETGAKLAGQPELIRVVEINNKRYTPAVTSEAEANGIVYHLSIEEIAVKFDVRYTVTENVLRMEIQNVEDQDAFVRTIHFPEQSIVALDGSLPGAELRVNDYRTEDIYKLSARGADAICDTTALAVLSGGGVAASINSGNANNRQSIAYQTVKAQGKLFTGLWTNEFQYRGLDEIPMTELWTEVAVTGDRNGDGSVNFMDGAIARRDDIGFDYVGKENATDMSMIVMDVGSAAQYPFLRVLDNIKKFSAASDGFGQMILIKGYQAEGHDSSHPDYANISQRAGGLEDFQTLLREAGKYNARIGVHINHTEAYPEAKQYSNELVAAIKGWSWYDQSYHLIRENDIMNQADGAEKRLEDLAALCEGNLSFVYVDTYQDSRWQAERLSKKINDLGWMLGTEYSEELVNRSTWSHTINSRNFNYDTPGNLVRFVENQNKDIFAASPLFRGLENRNKNAGFFGWQGCWSMDETMHLFYTRVLPQKYLASFPVSSWKTNTSVTLGAENQVVSKLEAGVNIITKDGRVVANGNNIFMPWDPIEETKIYHYNELGGTTTWQLPVSWEGETSVKVFRLSDEGRTDLETVEVKDGKVTLNADARTAYVLYKGTDATAETDLTTYDWTIGSPIKDAGFDSHTFGYAWDVTSTSGNTDHVTYVNNALPGAAAEDAKDNHYGNTHAHVQGGSDAALTQTMTGLTVGETYTVSAFVEANEGRKISVTVTAPSGEVFTNYADSYTTLFGIPHNDRYGTHYQRVKVTFVAEAETAELRLDVAADASADAWANLDNVRVVAVGAMDNQGHDFFEDFEHVDEAFGPFTCVTKVGRCHLSEDNGEWTKDVVSGRYSLKVRGNGEIPENKFEHLRTAPHLLRLKPNTTYTIGIDYIMPEAELNEECLSGKPVFTLMVRSDLAEAAGDTAAAVVLAQPIIVEDFDAHSTGALTFTTGDYADYYIDLYDETFVHEFAVDNLYLDEN